jgi:hypothetical protein
MKGIKERKKEGKYEDTKKLFHVKLSWLFC